MNQSVNLENDLQINLETKIISVNPKKSCSKELMFNTLILQVPFHDYICIQHIQYVTI